MGTVTSKDGTAIAYETSGQGSPVVLVGGTVAVPTLVIDGGKTPWLSQVAQATAFALPNARRHTLAGQPHKVEASAVAPALVEFFQGRDGTSGS